MFKSDISAIIDEVARQYAPLAELNQRRTLLAEYNIGESGTMSANYDLSAVKKFGFIAPTPLTGVGAAYL